MTDPREGVEALVLAAGQGERLGLGPKALLSLGGRTLLDRAVSVMQSVARRVFVGVPDELVDRVRIGHAGSVEVLVGGRTRLDTTLRLFAASSASLIVQHDIVHPFVTIELARRVILAARERGAAMAAVRAAAHVFRGNSDLVERVRTPEAVWLARKPLAFKRRSLERALEQGAAIGDDAGTPDLLIGAGQAVAVVPVEPWNIKVTSPQDWALAHEIEELLRRGRLGSDVASSKKG